jgi:hypothetical protein
MHRETTQFHSHCAHLLSQNCYLISPSPSLAQSLPPLLSPLSRSAQKGFPPPASLVDPLFSPLLSPLLCSVITGKNSTGAIHPPYTGAIHPPPAAASHVILLLARMPSTLLPRHLLHLLPSSARVIDVTIRSSPPLSVACSARVISVKDTTSGIRCSCFVYLASCWTMDPFGGLCSARDAGNRRPSQTPWL